MVDTILYGMASSLEGMGNIASISFMYVIQNIINIIIVSGSAKAALTMPIMAPFSDLIDLSRQATVMAYQFGDGFTNMITPTSPVLMGVLTVAKISYDKWFRWVWPLALSVAVLAGFGVEALTSFPTRPPLTPSRFLNPPFSPDKQAAPESNHPQDDRTPGSTADGSPLPAQRGGGVRGGANAPPASSLPCSSPLR